MLVVNDGEADYILISRVTVVCSSFTEHAKHMGLIRREVGS